MKQQKVSFAGLGVKNKWLAPAIGTGLFLLVSILWIFGLISLALFYAHISSPELKVAIALLIHLFMAGIVIGSVYKLLGIMYPFQSAIAGIVAGMLGYAGVTIFLNANSVLDGVVGTLVISFIVTLMIVFLSLFGAISVMKKLNNTSQVWGLTAAAVGVYILVLFVAGSSI